MLTRKTICSLCILTICNFSYFLTVLTAGFWVLIAFVPGLCILFTFSTYSHGITSGPGLCSIIRINTALA